MIIRLNGTPLYESCKNLEGIKGMCDTMSGDQMELYVSLKAQTLAAVAESSERLHSVGMVHAADVGASVAKFTFKITVLTMQHVDHLIGVLAFPLGHN